MWYAVICQKTCTNHQTTLQQANLHYLERESAGLIWWPMLWPTSEQNQSDFDICSVQPKQSFNISEQHYKHKNNAETGLIYKSSITTMAPSSYLELKWRKSLSPKPQSAKLKLHKRHTFFIHMRIMAPKKCHHVFHWCTRHKYSNHSKKYIYKKIRKRVPGNVREIKFVRILYFVKSVTFILMSNYCIE